MVTHIKSVEEFKEFIKNDKVVIDLFATWCGPCRMMTPVLEQLDKEHNELHIGKVDVDELSDIAALFNVSSIPTLLLISKGEVKYKQVGYMPYSNLDRLVKQYL